MAAGANETDLTLTYNTTGLPGLIWNYGIFIPTLSVFGILGNLLTLFVLWSKDKKFAGFIYYYIRGLAIVDLFQICFTLQVCKYQTLHNSNTFACISCVDLLLYLSTFVHYSTLHIAHFLLRGFLHMEHFEPNVDCLNSSFGFPHAIDGL